MSQTSSSPAAPPQSLAPVILRETRAIRTLLEETIAPTNPDDADGDPLRSLLDTQQAVLKALGELRASIEALHHRLDHTTRNVPAGGR